MPPGSFTVIIGLNAVLMTLMTEKWLTTGIVPLVAVALLTGIAIDVLYLRLRPDLRRPLQLRIFAFAIPATFYGLYFLVISLFGDGIWWTVHLWTGVILLAGLTGLLLTFLVIPPKTLSQWQVEE